MHTILSVILWEIAALSIVWAMMCETNRRIRALEEQKTETSDGLIPKKYGLSVDCCACWIAAALLTGIMAWRVSSDVTSILFEIEMGMCYYALLGAAVVDLKLRQIPNSISIFLLIAGGIAKIAQCIFGEAPYEYLFSGLLGALASFVLLFAASKLAKGGMGMGDIKILTGVGLVAGLGIVCCTMVVSLIICTVAAIILVAMKRKTWKDLLPFAPFLLLGFSVVAILGYY